MTLPVHPDEETAANGPELPVEEKTIEAKRNLITKLFDKLKIDKR